MNTLTQNRIDFFVEFEGDGLGRDPQFWQTLASHCAANDCHRVLLDWDCLDSELTTSEAYYLGVAAAERLPRAEIAILSKNFRITDNWLLFQIVASNRGLTVEFFTERSDATLWLQR